MMRQREGFDEIAVGDVIRWGRGLRKVRRVVRFPDGCVRVVVFAKLRRSGWPAPETQYWRTEIRGKFGGIVAREVSLCTTPIECAMQKQIERSEPSRGWELPVKEADTVGLVY